MTDQVLAHCTRGNLLDTVLAAVVELGHDPERFDPEVLAPFEEFHALGRQGSVELAETAWISSDDHVLDVGCGVGGPARFLAERFGCRVTGIDLTPELVETARELTRRVGLDDRVDIEQGDALAMPFAEATFDVTWTQHIAMNIADKAGLYREMRRVLKPGGRLALFDIVAGEGGTAGLQFPVPWASDPATSHLVTAGEVVSLVEAAGCKIDAEDDPTAAAMAFFAAAPAPTSPLGVHLLMGETMPDKIANLRAAFEEGTLRLLHVVAIAT